MGIVPKCTQNLIWHINTCFVFFMLPRLEFPDKFKSSFFSKNYLNKLPTMSGLLML